MKARLETSGNTCIEVRYRLMIARNRPCEAMERLKGGEGSLIVKRSLETALMYLRVYIVDYSAIIAIIHGEGHRHPK